MNRIESLFIKAKKENRKIFTAFLSMGYPTLELSEKAVETLIENGADIIEFGIPFSDPMADGPVIRKAAEQALKNGVTFEKILESAKRLRKKYPETPLVLFSYYNILFSRGTEKAAEMAADAGFDAVLAVDLPLEERDEFLSPLKKHGLTIVPLIAPATPPERIAKIAKGVEESFLYVITVNGVTGTRNELPEGLEERLNTIRTETGMPILAGFGVSKPEHAALISKASDGFIIGSAIEKILLDHPDESALPILAEFTRSFKVLPA